MTPSAPPLHDYGEVCKPNFQDDRSTRERSEIRLNRIIARPAEVGAGALENLNRAISIGSQVVGYSGCTFIDKHTKQGPPCRFDFSRIKL